MARVRVKYVTGALREHHDRSLEFLQLLYKALEARDAEALYKSVKFVRDFVGACHRSVEEPISRGCARRVPIRGRADPGHCL